MNDPFSESDYKRKCLFRCPSDIQRAIDNHMKYDDLVAANNAILINFHFYSDSLAAIRHFAQNAKSSSGTWYDWREDDRGIDDMGEDEDEIPRYTFIVSKLLPVDPEIIYSEQRNGNTLAERWKMVYWGITIDTRQPENIT